MATLAFLSFFDKPEGESIQKGKEKWIELQGWDWEVDAETSWTKGGGASVGKPNPGRLNWEHDFDTASPVILGCLCSGKAFAKVELQMLKTTGSATPETYFTMTMDGVFITAVHRRCRGRHRAQKVEMVFKTVKIEYRPQDAAHRQAGHGQGLCLGRDHRHGLVLTRDGSRRLSLSCAGRVPVRCRALRRRRRSARGSGPASRRARGCVRSRAR